MERFDIYFLGETLPTADPVTVREGVGRLFKLEGAAVERLFSGKPLRVKRDVEVDAASRYRAAFREVGALIQIVPAGAPPPAPPSARPASAPSSQEPAQRPAAPASFTQDPEPVAAVAVPTATEEQAALAQTLTLTIVEETFAEDDSAPRFAAGGPPGMTLAEPGATIDETPPAAPAEFDTRGLEALPANTGSLADCRVEKPARAIPDISHLRLVDD